MFIGTSCLEAALSGYIVGCSVAHAAVTFATEVNMCLLQSGNILLIEALQDLPRTYRYVANL